MSLINRGTATILAASLGVVGMTSVADAEIMTFDKTRQASVLTGAGTDAMSASLTWDRLLVGFNGPSGPWPGYNGTAQVGFDVSALAGQYTDIQSVTFSFTSWERVWNSSATDRTHDTTVRVYEVAAVDGDWTNAAIWSSKQGDAGSSSDDWSVGGANYTGTPLMQQTFPIATGALPDKYTFTLTGAAAKDLIDRWTAGQNYGLTFVADQPTDPVDGANFSQLVWIAGRDGTNGDTPKMSVTYVVPEPTALLPLMIGLLALKRRRHVA